jgi:hypothetical protein
MNSPNTQPSKQFFSVKDDARKMRDPSGTGIVGRAVGEHDFSKNADGHPIVLYRTKEGQDFFLTVDVHQLPGQPMTIYLYCPLCNNHLTIRQDNKAIDYDPHARVKLPGYTADEVVAGLGVAGLGGRLSVEPFRCTWEEKPDLRRSYGFGVCNWSVVIENNVARNV